METPQDLTALPCHALSSEHAFAKLSTRASGLTRSEVSERLVLYGRNELPRPRPTSVLRVFFRQFLSPLVYILLLAALISVALRDISDAGFIMTVLCVNALIGSIQEYGAERSAQALRALTVSKALVLREDEDHEIAAEELVPGDLVILEAGSKVPADLRLISDGGIEVDESLLTGESVAVSKSAAAIWPVETAIAERSNMAFAGTLVTRGRAHGIAVATGSQTQLGRIASSLSGAESGRPPLLVRMDRFSRRIALAVTVAVVVLGGVSVIRGNSLGSVFLLAVALAVSAIPEGLPVALTVALSIGARRMGQRKVIARRLVAVEALGSCTFIASDKTGTLTMNQLVARVLALPRSEPRLVQGQGHQPTGHIDMPSEEQAQVVRLCTAAALCNDGFFGLRDDRWVHHGDAVDVALLVLSHRAGVQPAALDVSHPRVAAMPFDPEHRFAATLHRHEDGLLAVVKGAGERILPMCTRMATPAGDVAIDIAALELQATKLAASGYRVLALAQGSVDLAGQPAADFAASQLRSLTFLGFIGMLDPLRPEAKDAIAACRAAGIQVAMVTGDHPVTALSIARELGFAEREDQVITGTRLAQAAAQGDAAVDALVREARVFARVEPTQKLQIVQALSRLGHFVAVTGDGANDAPALRAAHIGVAMGERGTDVAKESADLILADDNFASIVAGVEEGRISYANVRKVIYLSLASGAAEVLLFVLTTATGLPAPLWPVQLLWLNLVTNGIQDVALAFEPKEGSELKKPPRAPGEPIFNRLMIERMTVSALVISLVTFGLYAWMLRAGYDVAAAQNGALLLLVLFENIQAGDSRSETASAFSLSPLRNPLLLIGTLSAQLLHISAMYIPGLRDVLHLRPVSLSQWLWTLSLSLSLIVVTELHKWFLRRRQRAGRL
ncbi:MAG: HAD-IC family P-type ATPase [Myxococcales bacterium]|nr:HAD-IC family P-type ATPase [Myxococcales bacterium]